MFIIATARFAGAQSADPFTRMQNAEQLLNSGQAAVALEMLRTITAEAPPAVYRQAQFDIARAYEALGRLVDAAGAYRRIFELDPAAPDADNALSQSGRLYAAAGQPAEARASWESLLRAFPTSPYATNTRYSLADSRLADNDPERAAAALEPLLRSTNADERAQARRRLAEIYLRLGRFLSTEDAVRESLKITPDDFYLRNLLANALEKQKKYPEAIEVVEGMRRMSPGDVGLRDRLYGLYRDGGVLENKIAALEGEKRKRPADPEPWFALSSIYLFDNREVDALRELEGAVERKPDSLDSIVNLARLYFSNKWEKKSIDTLNALLEKHPDFFPAWRQLGDILKAQGQNDAARAAWEKSVRFNPADGGTYPPMVSIFSAHQMHNEAARLYESGRVALKQPDAFAMDLAFLYDALMRKRDAFVEYARVMEPAGSSPGMEARIVNIAAATGVTDFAVEHLRGRIAASPANRTLRLLLAGIHLAAGKTDEALNDIRDFQNANPGAENLYSALAARLRDAGRGGAAVPFYSAAADAETSPDAKARDTLMAGVCAEESGDAAGSAVYYRKLIDNFPKSGDMPEALFRLARIRAGQGDPEAAKTLYGRLADGFESSGFAADARLGQARAEFDMGRLDDAAKRLDAFQQTAVAMGRRDEILFLRGEIALLIGDMKTAQSQYKSVTESYPESRFVNDALFRLLFIGDIAEGDPTRGRALTEAMLLRRTGKPDEAAAAMRGLIALAPDAAMVSYARFELGEDLAAAGKTEEAITAFQQAEADNGNDELRQRAFMRESELQWKLNRRPEALLACQRLLAEYPGGYWAAESQRRMEAMK